MLMKVLVKGISNKVLCRGRILIQLRLEIRILLTFNFIRCGNKEKFQRESVGKYCANKGSHNRNSQ